MLFLLARALFSITLTQLRFSLSAHIHLLSCCFAGMWEAQTNWDYWSSALNHNNVVMGTIIGSIVVFAVVLVGGIAYAIRRAVRGGRDDYQLIA